MKTTIAQNLTWSACQKRLQSTNNCTSKIKGRRQRL